MTSQFPHITVDRPALHRSYSLTMPTMPRLTPTLLALALLPAAAHATTLYSGAALPSAEGAQYAAIGPATQTLGPSAGVTLDTTATSNTYAGYFYALPANTLNKTAGFDVSITTALLAESHTKDARAALSFLILASDHTGIELALQPTLIFAQTTDFGGPTATTLGESAPFNTTALTTYHITVSGTTYTLSANGAQLLTGPLRDYSATTTPFGPIYSNTDTFFLGDDTTSASGTFHYTAASVVPEPTTYVLVTLAPATLALRRPRSTPVIQ